MAKAVHADLPGFRQLLADSWQYYRANLSIFLLLALIYTLFSLGPILAIDFFRLAIPYMAVATIISMIVGFWYQLALILAVKADGHKMSIAKLAESAVPLMGAFLWLMILTMFILLGGSLLFLIPGLILAVLFSFAPYVLVNEKVFGLEALDRSVQYFGNRFWGNLGRLALLTLIFIIIAVVFAVLVDVLAGGSFDMFHTIQSIDSSTGSLSGEEPTVFDHIFSIISLLVGQLFVIFTYRLYLASKKIKGTPDPLPARRKTGYIVLALGVPIIALIAFFVGVFK